MGDGGWREILPGRTSGSITILPLLQFFLSQKMSCLVRITVACLRWSPSTNPQEVGQDKKPSPSSSCPTAQDSLAQNQYRPGPSQEALLSDFYQSEKMKTRKMQGVCVRVCSRARTCTFPSFCPFLDRVILHSEIIPFLGKSPFFLLKYPFFYELIIITVVLLLNQCFFSFPFFNILTRQRSQLARISPGWWVFFSLVCAA